MAKKKRKLYLNIEDAIKLLSKGYGLNVRELNWYTLRICHEESEQIWDWFHTQGTLVENEPINKRRVIKNLGHIYEEEEVAKRILQRLKVK